MAQGALIVIDVLNDFLNPRGALYCGDQARKIIPALAELIGRFSGRKDLVVYLTDAHSRADREFEVFPAHAVRGSWGARIIPELLPPPDSIVLPKKRYSGFYGTGLSLVLRAFAPEHVTVAGLCTSICVMDTVGGLRNRDFPVSVAVDTVADFDPAAHEFALQRMAKIYGAKLVYSSDPRIDEAG